MLHLLRSQLRHASRQDLRGHCDAETLTAFSEGRLPSQERKQVAYHLSLCDNCREMLSLASQAAAVRAPVSRPATWLTVAAALICVCITVLYLRSGPPPAEWPKTAQPAVPTPAPPTKFLPRLTEAHISAPPIAGADLLWKVNSSFHPPTLEVSPDKGRTWKEVKVPDFQPKSVAWKEPAVWAVDAHGAVMQSEDNGAHWIKVPSAVPGSSVR